MNLQYNPEEFEEIDTFDEDLTTLSLEYKVTSNEKLYDETDGKSYMAELSEKAKLARSIPAKKKRKSAWCKGFILSKPMSDYEIPRANFLNSISKSARHIRSKTYRE